MSARVCRSCEYTVVSTVVSACPNCGERLPAFVAPTSSSFAMAGLGLVLVAGAAAFAMLREPATAPAAAPPSTSPTRRTAEAPKTPAAVVGSAARTDEARVAKLVALLDVPDQSYDAASELAKLDSPRAQKALMAAYDRRDYGKMVGATAFYARRKPPGYEKVLVTLLLESRDLAVAQELILSREPKLAGPATKWAAEQGFKLVKSSETPA